MIASLRGKLLTRDATSVVLDVGGVGYRVMLSTQSLAAVGEGSGEVALYTSMIIREDHISLYGFLDQREQQLFEKLITVSGIGPKVAISALSAYNPDVLSEIITGEDVARMAMVSGIGKKTAQRIILELKGSIAPAPAQQGSKSADPAYVQATNALLGMGFTPVEASLALDDFADSSEDASALVRHALKRLGSA